VFKLNLFNPFLIIALESVLLVGFLVIRFLALPKVEGWTFFQFENGKRYEGLKEMVFWLFAISMTLLLVMPIILYGLRNGYEREVTLLFDSFFIFAFVFIPFLVVCGVLGMKYQEEGQPVLMANIPYYNKLSLVFLILGVISVLFVLGFTDFSMFGDLLAENTNCN
jgi:hypothetical protein